MKSYYAILSQDINQEIFEIRSLIGKAKESKKSYSNITKK